MPTLNGSSEQKSLRHSLIFWLVVGGSGLAVIVVLFIGFRMFLFQVFYIPTGSMQPTLRAGDYFLVSKMAYWHEAPERGDIVIHRSTSGDDSEYVRRIIGLPGERIRLLAGVVYINDVAVKKERIEDYVGPTGTPEKAAVPQYWETLPNGVSHGVIDLTPNGGADNTDEYVVPAGYYFMLGDNRDNSMDSRFDSVGFIPRDHVIGRVTMRISN